MRLRSINVQKVYLFIKNEHNYDLNKIDGMAGHESGVRSQGSEVRGQKSGVRSQGSEVRGQKSGVRSQESEVRSQKSGTRGQGAKGRDRGSPINRDFRFAPTGVGDQDCK
jgi:hypothetical protein